MYECVRGMIPRGTLSLARFRLGTRQKRERGTDRQRDRQGPAEQSWALPACCASKKNRATATRRGSGLASLEGPDGALHAACPGFLTTGSALIFQEVQDVTLICWDPELPASLGAVLRPMGLGRGRVDDGQPEARLKSSQVPARCVKSGEQGTGDKGQGTRDTGQVWLEDSASLRLLAHVDCVHVAMLWRRVDSSNGSSQSSASDHVPY